jgi:hypothetical protein
MALARKWRTHKLIPHTYHLIFSLYLTMPKPQWTNFFSPTYEDWFERFPCPDPTDTELAEADGDLEVARAKVRKAVKNVSAELQTQ